MKIAVVTEDEKTISQHFGMAPLYRVFTVEDGKITARETRSKAGHGHGAGQGHPEHHGQGGQHGFDAAAQNIHASMADSIKDCQVMITRGMGMGAYYSLKQYNIEPYISDVADIEEAVKLQIEGKLTNFTDRLH
jgi:predicted Fe-Mo cluster-binding NifX family protein